MSIIHTTQTLEVSRRYLMSDIRLINFRNFDDYGMSLEDVMAIVGDNGVGKSNILEAMSLFYPGSGMRGARYSDMAKFGSKHWVVTATVNDGIRDKRIEVAYSNNIKEVKINKSPVEKVSDLADNIVIVWLTPRIVSDFSVSHAARRSFFDRVVYAFYSGYAHCCASYIKLINERSRLLRSVLGDDRWLSSLEFSISGYMLKILKSRKCIADGIGGLLGGTTLQMIGAAEKLSDLSDEEAQDSIIKSLRANRDGDAMRGGSSFGPHRTRFVVSRNSVPFDFCSTGDKKLIMLDILLAQIRLKISRDKEYPVLLLDDIADGLSEKSFGKYLDVLKILGCQIVMTGSNFPPEMCCTKVVGETTFASIGD